jgi:hypothetical protein
VADSTARAASEEAGAAAGDAGAEAGVLAEFESLGQQTIRGRAEPIEVYAARG